MSVMNERLQRLALSADRPDVVLRILAFEGPHTVLGKLSANLGLAPGNGAARHDVAGTRQFRNDITLGGRKHRPLRRITCQVLSTALPGPHRCKELTPKTTESHWSGGQREP
jgi:hypothetical protein